MTSSTIPVRYSLETPVSVEPFVKCSNIKRSLAFYSQVLDFNVSVPPNPDPSSFESRHAILERKGSLVHLSSHRGDGVFGNRIYVRVTDVDALYDQFVSNGLNTTDRECLPALRGGPVEQSWRMKEFWVLDPDGNAVVFGQTLSS